MMRTTVLLSLLLGCHMAVQGQHVIHVATTGCDESADGSPTKPFASLPEAYQHALDYTGTDTVYIHLEAGRYQLDQSFEIARTPQVPVVICGTQEGGEVATILSGGIRLSNWKENAGGVWTTQVDATVKYGFTFEQLYVNGRRARRARTPDKGWFFISKGQEDVHYQGEGRSPEYATQRFEVTPQDLNTLRGIGYEDSNDVMAMFFHHWDNTRKYLSYIEPISGLIFLNGAGLKPWNPITQGSRYVLENYKNALTAEGEWFLDKNTGELSYIPRKGEDMRQAQVFAPSVTTLLRVKGTAEQPIGQLTLRDIAFEHSAYVMPKTGNDAEQAAASISAAIHLDFAKDVTFDNCIIRHTGNYGIWFNQACYDCTLTHSWLTDLGAGGVKIGQPVVPKAEEVTRGITIDNNIIQKTGNVLPCGVGVAVFHSSHNKILHNEISNLMYSGISIGWIWGYGDSYANHNEVAFNNIHHIGWGELSDMGAVYTLGISHGTHIHHNVIHDVYSYDYGGWGLYTDEGSTGIVMENNLVYACKSGSFHQHYGRDNIIRNNIFAFGQYHQLQLTRVEEHCSFHFTNNIILADCGVLFAGPWDKAQLNMKKNLYWDLRTPEPDFMKMEFSQWRKVRDSQSILANPLFVNPQAGDFHFQNNKNVRRIGFKPFDYTQAGVYGSIEWKEKAQMSDDDIERFKQIIVERERTLSSYYK